MKKVVTFLMIIFAITYVCAQEEVIVEEIETQVEQVETQAEKVETTVVQVVSPIDEIETQAVDMQNANPFTYGVKGGVNFSIFNGSIELGTIEINPRFYTGFTLGAFVDYKITDKFSVKGELLFSRKGSRFEEIGLDIFDDMLPNINIGGIGNLLGTELEMYVGTNWLEIPILGVYQVDDKLKLFGGPYLGFYLSGKAYVEAKALVFELIDRDYVIEREDLQLPDVGMIVGASYDFTPNIAIETRFNYGFVDVADEIIFGFLSDDVIVAKNMAIQLLLNITL